MPACRSCGGDFSGVGTCPHCGAKGPSLDVPDLDLSSVSGPVGGAASKAMSAAPPRLETRRTSGAMAAVMTSDDVLAEDAGEASFELAVGPGDIGMPPSMSSALSSGMTSTPPGSLQNPSFNPGPLSSPPASGNGNRGSGSMPRVSAPPRSGSDVSRPDIPISHQPSSARDPSRPDVRVSRPPAEPEPPRVDPLEARAFADFGEAPAGALQAPIYAIRVKMRQSELRRGLWRAKIAFERAQKEQARALADPSRLDEVKARLAADVEAREKDVDLHEAALEAFDGKTVKRGMQIAFTVAALLFLAIFVPVFFRMCVGVEAAPLNTP